MLHDLAPVLPKKYTSTRGGPRSERVHCYTARVRGGYNAASRIFRAAFCKRGTSLNWHGPLTKLWRLRRNANNTSALIWWLCFSRVVGCGVRVQRKREI